MTAVAARPRDVVLAGALTILGSVFALVGIFSTQGQLRSSQVRRQIEDLLASGSVSGFDLSVETVLNLVEVGLMVASAASVAAIVLAVYVMRRHNPSRIALTLLGGVAALVLLLSWPAGVLVAIFVAYTVSLLWRAPVRGWFAMASDGSRGGSGESGGPGGPGDAGDSGRSGDAGAADRPGSSSDRPDRPGPYPGPWPPDAQTPGDPGREGHEDQGWQRPQQPYPPPQQGPPQPQQYPHEQPPPPGPYGYPQGHGGPPGYPAGYGYPSGYYGYPSPYADPDKRPVQVVTAHVMTWVGAGLFLLAGVGFVIATASPEVVDLVVEQLPAADIDRDQFVSTLRIAGVLTALWSLAVLVVSVFSWRRANWAAIVLTVMGGAYLLLQLVSLLAMGQIAVIVTISYVTAVIVLLWWPASRRWYAGAGRSGPHGQHGPPGGGSPYAPPQPPRRRNQPW